MDLSFKDTTDTGVSRPSTQVSGHFILRYFNRSTALPLFVILLLFFLLCSSIYLVFRVEALQKQVIYSSITCKSLSKLGFFDIL